MSIYTGLTVVQQRAAEKVANRDKLRVSMYGRVGVHSGRACVTDGHRAYNWPTTETDDTIFSASTGVRLADDGVRFPSLAQVFEKPNKINKIKVDVPPNTGGVWTLARVDGRPCWVRSGDADPKLPDSIINQALFAVNIDYLREAHEFLSGEKAKKTTSACDMIIEYTDDCSPLYLTRADPLGAVSVVVMPVQL